MVAPCLGHFDDTDAQLYQVVIRKMAESRRWLDPSYLNHFHVHFREHLPFGFWPFAIARLSFGEQGPRFLAAAISLTIVIGVGLVGRRLMGDWPALAAMLVLASTETFFRYGAQTRLDGLVVLFGNAAAVPAILGSRRAAHGFVAAVCAAVAVLVKGPFGLVPLLAAVAARAIVDRSASTLIRGLLIAVAASIPTLVFLLLDRSILHAGWWASYVQGQVVSSAMGRRTDGSLQWWFPFASVAGRFWPGMALLAVVPFALQRRHPAWSNARLLLVFCLLMLVELCIPARKVWNHELAAYPGLSLLAGAAVLPASKWLESAMHRRWVALVTTTAGIVLAVSAPRIGAMLDGAPCVGSSEFAGVLDQMKAGDPILVVSNPTSWRTLASLAAERRLEPQPESSIPVPSSAGPGVALVEDALIQGPVAGWRPLKKARGWTVLARASTK
jgi:4-amino-4-deoxy-L-arabinose transferase-like glycosyltransferase